MENGLTIGKQNMVSLVTDNPLGDLIKPLSHEILLFDSYVAGTAYIDDETVFEEIKEGAYILLIFEADRPWISATSAFAGPFDYSEETKRLLREAGMDEMQESIQYV